MLIKCLPVGHLMTNCYIVTDETTLECAVIDPGDESNTILYYLEDNHLTCRAILLTHGHYDHTGAVYAVHEETGAPVYMNALDAGTAVAFDSYTFTPPEGTIFYKEGDEVKDFAFGDVIGGDGRDHLALFPGQPVLLAWWQNISGGMDAARRAVDLAQKHGKNGLVVLLVTAQGFEGVQVVPSPM